MIDRKKLQHLTDFNRRKIQELHNIVANNKNKQGVKETAENGMYFSQLKLSQK